MEYPKKWWWVVLVALPIVLALVGTQFWGPSGSDDPIQYVEVTGIKGPVAFNSITVIEEQIQQSGGEISASVLAMLRESSGSGELKLSSSSRVPRMGRTLS